MNKASCLSLFVQCGIGVEYHAYDTDHRAAPSSWRDHHGRRTGPRVPHGLCPYHSEWHLLHTANTSGPPQHRSYASMETRIKTGIDSRLGGETLCLSHCGYTSGRCCILPTSRPVQP
jgi:hypothetical protein